jgi:putative oxidoreductase
MSHPVALVGLINAGYPLAFNLVLLVARIFVGGLIFSHGFRKFFRGGKIAGTAGWFEGIGVKPGKINALAAATTEVGAGVLLILGLLTPLAAAGLIGLMMVAIVTVHGKNGFFITNPGGGMEFCLTLIMMALVLGTFGAGKYSLDNAGNILGSWSHATDLIVCVALGLGGALVQLAACYRPPKKA